MNLRLEEAISLFETWRSEQTELDVHFSTRKENKELRARVKSVAGTAIMLAGETEDVEVQLEGADFNGDRGAPLNAKHGSYLVCEFRNDDRWAFYAPAKPKGKASNERRSPV
jgi:hypothetical protein